MSDYLNLNFQVMTDTVKCCQTIPELKFAIGSSIEHQYMVSEDENIPPHSSEKCSTTFICSGKRSFEAAKCYPGSKVAVLNYANNHVIGGAPFYSNTQEESLCRCSTLYPCLQAMDEVFYKKHQREYLSGKLSNMGNDDLIYTPNVVVFKTDDPMFPKIMTQNEWYNVNVITCAAPEILSIKETTSRRCKKLIAKRIKRILDVAAKERNEVLILGAWGCGAFGNSMDVVAKAFMDNLIKYNFKTVEFALSVGDGTGSPFNIEIAKHVNNI